MRLQGLHHVTMITGDAQRNVDFYAGTLGLRLVKQTVNFDDPGAYHLYFGDERGSPGSILTWFEYAGARRGVPGAGMVHTLQLGLPSAEALGFWAARLAAQGVNIQCDDRSLRFQDWEGLRLELVVAPADNLPLVATHPEIPREFAITGVEGARAYAAGAMVEEALLTETLGFTQLGGGSYRLDGRERQFQWTVDLAERGGLPGAGTVHHIAWATADDEQLTWRRRLLAAGSHVTDVKDRDYFRSIYFREPNGVLFEIATLSPGFAIDEDPERLGEALRVPAMHAHLRERIAQALVPIVNPRVTAREAVTG